MQRKVAILSILVGFGVLSSCSKKSHEEHVQMFFGECRLEVVSKTPDAEIMVDGVIVGKNNVSLEVPCGEKRIDVFHDGFVPFHKFYPVNKDQAVKVTVELEKAKKLKNEALSSELIDSLRVKVAKKDPSATAGKPGGAEGATGGVESFSDDVENWR